MRRINSGFSNRPRICHWGKVAGAISLGMLLGLSFSATFAAGQVAAPPSAIADKSEQRKLYDQAQQALSASRYTDYRKLAVGLEHYPLLPYLEYRYIRRRLSRVGANEIDQFLADYPDSYLAEKLERAWVEKLAERRQWQNVLKYYRADNSTSELKCYQLRARVITSDQTAFDEVVDLWNVGKSQHKACDPLFAAWQDAGYLSDDIAWQRFEKTMQARQRSLARYVSRQMSAPVKELADLYYQVDRNPKLLKQMSRFSEQSDRMQSLILHGLQRLSLRDSKLAIDLWHRYDAQQLFNDEDRLTTQRYIAVRLLRQGHTAETHALLASSPALNTESVIESLVRDALRNQDWQGVAKWIAALPEATQQSERWRYWSARALAQTGTEEAVAKARDIYSEVAGTRSFYGFLASDILQQEYQLLDKPLEVSGPLRDLVASNPAIQRARELLIIGDNLNARREWYHTTQRMSEPEIVAAGKLAESWGWHRNGIQAMIQVSYWDDLGTRFPLAYQEHVESTAKDTTLEPHLLFAIARQESAFTPDARSSAGALGLMQLLPSTAKQTASRAGMRVSNHDLLNPQTNIALGGRYLNQLMEQFGGNRILAAAAYNAGPYRVKQWLNRDENTRVPYDIWIETIPYRETRGYVQNVLAYSVIYGYRLGDKRPFIRDLEAANSL
ncbi:transglycosylase SLT domain-containing protein [Gilvimarinus sp. SDUM040013]|uniref:Transglycosylase SLT domain-containing protein n=1 Tax=Gilvimarinus gilvus TaxID=3058038 RepID=A0ABU4RZG5_9GAMM|nr:transglycosylase SLT domain-containing protein [Gilvimarinus sp. SDUM040013]MDO3386400.1 transglycosylase SLT domain-containing protein [Gilvimarinus sp. SDUM040013]MDX6849666.1 transglycosylase SLT domain-containing protein [Gilvimarinus sp. SDUM040013]